MIQENKCINCDCPSDSMCGCACHSIISHSQEPAKDGVKATGGSDAVENGSRKMAVYAVLTKPSLPFISALDILNESGGNTPEGFIFDSDEKRNKLFVEKSVFDARVQKLKDEISKEIHPMMNKKHEKIMKIIDSVMKG